MLATVGMATTLGLGLSLVVMFYRLRQYVCPHCKATGSLTTIELLNEEQPQLGITTTIRTRRCGDCGAVITDHRRQPIAATSPGHRRRQRRLWRLRHLPRPFPISIRSFPADR